MRTTYWVPGARRRGISLVAGIALLCFAGAMVSSSPARAADHPRAESELLTIGDGYAQPQVSTRVRALQRRLRTLGLRPGPVDGLFGSRTGAAVESLQRTAGLHVDGMVGPETRAALRRASAPVLGRGAGYGEQGGSLQVRRLQRQLRRLGLRPGPVDGLYGRWTAAAVARFQRARRAMADGVAWFRTRRAIAIAGERVSRRLAEDRGTARPSTQGSARQVTSPSVRLVTTPAANKESGDISRILISGLIALALVALVVRFGRKLAVAGASVIAGRGASPPPDRPASPSPTAEPANAAADERQEAVEGVGRDEAIGYIRPADPRIGWLEARWQITAMDTTCEQLGLRLVLVAHDGGNAGGARPDRPGLKHALERLAASDRGCLIVAELRALGDSVAELGHVLGPLRDRGVRLVAVDAGFDTAAEDGVLAATALTSLGGAEDGRGGPPRRAMRVPSARGPGGPAVRDIPGLQERIAMMRSAGMTLQAIADRLNRDSVPTVRGGREWRPSGVRVAAGDRRPRRLSLRHRVGAWARSRANNR